MSIRSLALALCLLGCSSSGGDASSGEEDETAGGDVLAVACDDRLDDVYALPAEVAAPTADARGEIVRCAKDRTVAAPDLDRAARAVGYAGPPLASGAHVLRVTYRTERVSGAPATQPALSSALVLLPDKPRAARHPVVVVAHGSVGVAEACAPSRGDLLASGTFLDDARSLALPLAGYGYTVIMPDYAGFGFGGTTGWSISEDEAHSLLDATRAMERLIKPATLSGDVVMVGHSQGGHAVLSAHAYAPSYGLAGRLAGVVAEAPLWIPARSWGAALTDVLGFRPDVNADALAFAVQYFYVHGEVYDGPGHGTDMFERELKDAVKGAVTSACLDTLADRLSVLGKHPSDLFSALFTVPVATCADTGVCVGETAATWRDRFRADRPSIAAKGGAPLLVLNGGADGTVTPSLAQCGFEKIRSDLKDGGTTPVTFCVDHDAIHGAVAGKGPVTAGITRRNADYINRWIAARTLGAPEPAPCAPWTGTAPDGNAIKCPSLPPNTDF